MASLKALKIRIGSVKSTQKITKALNMVGGKAAPCPAERHGGAALFDAHDRGRCVARGEGHAWPADP